MSEPNAVEELADDFEQYVLDCIGCGCCSPADWSRHRLDALVAAVEAKVRADERERCADRLARDLADRGDRGSEARWDCLYFEELGRVLRLLQEGQ